MKQTASLPPMSCISRVERLDTLLEKTLERRHSLRSRRGERISALDPIHSRMQVIRAVLAWALRGQEEPPSVQRVSVTAGLMRVDAVSERLGELVERVYAWSIAVACELLSIESLSGEGDLDEDAEEFARYAPRAIALLDETVGPLLAARKCDDLALASIRRIVSDLRQTLVLCSTPCSMPESLAA